MGRKVRIRARWDLSWWDGTAGGWQEIRKGQVAEVTRERAEELLFHGYAERVEPGDGPQLRTAPL